MNFVKGYWFLNKGGDLRDLLIDGQAERFEANTDRISRYVHGAERYTFEKTVSRELQGSSIRDF